MQLKKKDFKTVMVIVLHVFVCGFCALFVIVNIYVSVWFNYFCVFVTLSVSACVFVDVSVPDASVKKKSSGESRNRDRSQRASSDPQLKDLCGSHTLEKTVGAHHILTGMSHRVISCKQ